MASDEGRDFLKAMMKDVLLDVLSARKTDLQESKRNS
jgi:hypothetical protein